MFETRAVVVSAEGGVAMAAIKGLRRQNQTLERQNRSLNARLSRLEGSGCETHPIDNRAGCWVRMARRVT